MIINTWRDPYDAGFSPTRPKQIDIRPGLTVLVGCNGAGKTTLLNNIKDEMFRNKIPCHKYDNLKSGGIDNIFGSLMAGGVFKEEGDDFGLAVAMYGSSEGECIKMNVGRQSRFFREFFETGYIKDKDYRFSKIFNKEDEKIETNKRVLLFDAVDSGLSVDSVVELVNAFNEMLKDAESLGVELYLIISANEYELARGNNCFDVNAGKYLTFTDYEDYRSFIIKSRQRKEKRIERQIEYMKKKEQKIAETKAKYEPLIQEIKDRAKAENRCLSFNESQQIRKYESIIKNVEY